MNRIKYSALFSPLQINNLMLKNRVIAAPMGIPNARMLSSDYYGGISLPDKAKGGSGAIVFSSYGTADIAHCQSPFDKYARSLTRETLTLIEEAGAVGVMEFNFHPKLNEDGTVQSPSDGIAYNRKIAKAMTKEQMQEQINDLANQCKLAKDFGFRMLMLHFGHDSQCSIFLSPVWNQRTDEYGGCLDNRIRFAREALIAVRQAVGKDFPLMVRISRKLMIPETFAEDDMYYFVKANKDLVDIWNVSAGMDCYGGDVDHYEANVYTHTTIFEPRGYNLPFAKRIKQEIGVKVCLVGGLSDPSVCNSLIANQEVDAVMLGRQLIADPFWPIKAQQGRDNEIEPCLRCLNCYHIATEHANVQCSVNPRFRREKRVPVKEIKTDNPKKVVVVGGGPAGMKAALSANAKGHEVILIEKAGELGGQLKIAGIGRYKEDIEKLKDHFIERVYHSKIKVMLNTKADINLLKALEPDDLIIAIGAEFITPPITGIEFAMQAKEALLLGSENLQGKSLIIGGGTIGSELALDLAEEGKEVMIVEMSDTLCAKGNKLYRIALRYHMEKCTNLKTYLKAQVIEIKKNGAWVQMSDGHQEFLVADQIILSVGLQAKTQEAFALYGVTPQTSMIGDCKRVATIIEAVNDGYFAGVNVQ